MWGRPRNGSSGVGDGEPVGSAAGELTLRRSSKDVSTVVLSSRRITYLLADEESVLSVAAVLMMSDVIKGIFCMVPLTGDPSWGMVTRVPGGNGSAMGSELRDPVENPPIF